MEPYSVCHFPGPGTISLVVAHFWMTWVTEALCIGAVYRLRRQQGIPTGLHRRLDKDLTDTARIWVLPLYMWGFEACCNLVREVINAPQGLSNPPLWFYLTWFYQAGLALFVLVICQSLGVLLIDRRSLTLGLSGARNLAGIAVILSVFFSSVTYLWFIPRFLVHG